MKTTTKQACQLHSHEAFANVMGLVISVVWYLQADIPVIMHLRHLSVNCELARLFLLVAAQFKLCNAATEGHCMDRILYFWALLATLCIILT